MYNNCCDFRSRHNELVQMLFIIVKSRQFTRAQLKKQMCLAQNRLDQSAQFNPIQPSQNPSLINSISPYWLLLVEWRSKYRGVIVNHRRGGRFFSSDLFRRKTLSHPLCVRAMRAVADKRILCIQQAPPSHASSVSAIATDYNLQLCQNLHTEHPNASRWPRVCTTIARVH